jgi:hypothetical protein
MEASPPKPDSRTAAAAELRRTAIAWVETHANELLLGSIKLTSASERGRSVWDSPLGNKRWVGIKEDPRNLLLEAYELIHPVA